MFSADSVSQSHSSRPKRTRQTSSNDDSIKLPVTKKRRSALRQDTFKPLAESNLKEVAGRDQATDKQNGGVVDGSKHARAASQSRELTLRGGKKAEKRTERGGGLLTLSTNDFYTVAQLPALPDVIRSRPSVPYSCVISPEYDYVLALTHTDALVWPYNASASTPSSRDLVSLKLPFPPASTEDPLPLAAFTAKSANGEPGIVVVAPKGGKIIYWDSISNASSFLPGDNHHSIEGTVSGMLTGETVKDLISTEPAGLVMTLSHGRVAHLTVRDQLGRPSIGLQWLRKSSVTGATGGLFGSIRNVLGADRRKGTPLVRTGRSAKSQRDVVVCTEDGEIEFWNVNTSTGNSLARSFNIKETLLNSVKSKVTKPPSGQQLHFKVVDLDVASTPSTRKLVRQQSDEQSESLVFLTAITDNEHTQYFMTEAVTSPEGIAVGVVYPIRCYKQSVVQNRSWRPRLSLSKVQPVAFLLFEKAVVLASLTTAMESPSSQLLGEQAEPSEPFQDCIRFQDDTTYRILNFALEEHDKDAPACVFAVQAFGVVRVTSHLKTDDEETDEVEAGISAKTKIEQAIFFGTKKGNPLDLMSSSEKEFAPEEIRLATLEISQEILSSLSKFLPKSSSSIQEHMKQRAIALQDLVDHVLKHYPNCISREDRIILLWNAEKLAAAQAIWKVQEEIQQTYPHDDEREMTYLNFALTALHESRQRYPQPEKGETDHVRHWLVHSVFRVDHLLSELESCIKDLPNMEIHDPRIVGDWLTEAVRLWTAAYRAAFAFRENNAPLYGLGDEIYEDGVLVHGYPLDMKYIWTSAKEPRRFARDLIADVCDYLREWWDYAPPAPSTANSSKTPKSKRAKEVPSNLDGKPYEPPSKSSLQALASRLPTQVELLGRILTEHNIQERAKATAGTADPVEKTQVLARSKAGLQTTIKEAIIWIAPFNRDGSVALAEKVGDTALLVDLNLAYIAELARQQQASARPEEAKTLHDRMSAIQENVETYFDRFGNRWAYAHFSNLVRRGEVGRMLAEAQTDNGKKQPFLDWFLKATAERNQQMGKVAWINDVIGENKFTRAGTTLSRVANEQETDLWSKKTEICLAKLADLAALESEEVATSPLDSEDQQALFSTQLLFLEIMESLGVYIQAATRDALDDMAGVQLAFDLFVPKAVQQNKRGATRKLLMNVLTKIVRNEVLSTIELVDALTLLELGEYRGEPDQDPGITGFEYSIALRAVDLSDSVPYSSSAPPSAVSSAAHEKEVLRNVIWRRLLTADDWSRLNETAGKSDRQVTLAMQNTVLFKTLLDLLDGAEKRGTRALSSIPSNINDLVSDDRVFPGALKRVYEAAGLSDGEIEKLQEDARTKAAKLRTYIDKARLNEHFGGLVKEAKQAVREFLRASDRDGDGREHDEVDGDDVAEGEHGEDQTGLVTTEGEVAGTNGS